ncbi:MAG: glycosyltransferase [Alphaproteobacteria bacterium]|nr:glycosyltransferase [Alphaproteobacteria bacterium]
MAELSIIIPTLNASAGLRRSLPPLAAFEAINLVHEVIFADADSDDDTRAVAEASGARVVQSERGRGQQLAAGAEAATGRWMLFLHADTSLDLRWYEAVWTFMQDSANGNRAGYFRFKLDDKRKRAKLLERLVSLRVHLFGLPYGDQGLLISRAFYDEIGGYRPLPLMEDVDIVRRIGRRRLVRLSRNAVTSADRYHREGYLWRPVRNLGCLLLYFLGVPARFIVRLYG